MRSIEKWLVDNRHGLFGDREEPADAYAFARQVLVADGANEAIVLTALQVFINTLGKCVKEDLKEEKAGHDKYLAVVEKLRKRYAIDGMVEITTFYGKWSTYSLLEQLAWKKYILGESE